MKRMKDITSRRVAIRKNGLGLGWKSFLVLLLFALSLAGRAQDEEPVYKALSVSEIPDYISQSQLRLFELDKQLNAEKKNAASLKKIEAIRHKSDSLQQEFEGIDSLRVGLNELDKWTYTWQNQQAALNAIMQPVEEKLQVYDVAYRDVDTRYQVLLETRLFIKNANVSQEVRAQVDSARQELRTMRTRIKKRQEQYLEIKTAGSRLQNTIALELTNIKNVRTQIVKSLLNAEQLPLWKTSRQTNKEAGLSTVTSRIQAAKKNLKQYAQEHPLIPVVFGLLLVFTYLLVRVLRKSLQKAGLEAITDKNKAMKLIMHHPLLFSLVVSFFILLASFYLSLEANNLVMLLALPFLLRLIYELFPRLRFSTFAVFSLYYLFRELDFLYDSSSFQGRLLSLLVCVVTIVMLFAAIRFVHKQQVFKSWYGFLRFILYVLILMNILAIPFNLNGNVRLADLMLRGTVSVVVTGILLLSVFTILFGFVKLLFLLPQVRKSNIIVEHGEAFLLTIRKIIGVLFLLYWIRISLQFFGLFENFMLQLKAGMHYQIRFGDTSFTLNNVASFLIAITISVYISRLLKLILEKEIFPRKTESKGSSSTIILLIRFSVITLGFFIAIAAAGIGLDKISIIIGAIGVGIGFGLQDIFNNLVSGIVLAVERPISVGDTIEVGELTGVVQEIGFRSSRVRTYDGAEVVVPNGDIVSNQMINWTLSDRRRRLKIDFCVGRDTDPEEVLEILRAISVENDDIVQDPAPRPRFMGFGEGSLEFQLLFWIADYENGFTIGTETMLKLYRKLKEHNIVIPYPQRDMHLHGYGSDEMKGIDYEGLSKS